MDFQTDREFLMLASPHLERFSKQSADVWKCRCPFCGDSTKNKYKTRFYIGRNGDGMGFYCHNCGETGGVYKLLKHISPILANEYTMKTYLQKGKTKKEEFSYTSGPALLPIASSDDIQLPTIASLPEDHATKVYLRSRLLPEKQFEDLYFTENYAEYITKISPEETKKLEPDARVVIPLRNSDGVLVGVQGNSLYGEGIKYITCSLDKSQDCYWNADKIDYSQTIYVFEGAYDAMFIPNSVAICGSSLWKFEAPNAILVFDNEPRNPEILKQMEKAIAKGQRVCLWPNYLSEFKDINSMVLGGHKAPALENVILAFSYSGLRARLEFDNWKKVAIA